MGTNSRGLSVYLSCLAAAAVICAPDGYSQSSQAARDSVLVKVADIPLPGRAVRFDYQSLDAEHGRLYIAHMNADQLVVFVGSQDRHFVDFSLGCRFSLWK